MEYPNAITLYLDDQMKKTLDRLKASEGYSINAFIRRAIYEKLRRMGHEPAAPTPEQHPETPKI